MDDYERKTASPRRGIFIPANRLGCLMVPFLMFSIAVGIYMVVQAIEGIWLGEMLVRTRRGGRISLTDARARLAGAGLLLAGPAFAALPLGILFPTMQRRWILIVLFAGSAMFIAGLIWDQFG